MDEERRSSMISESLNSPTPVQKGRAEEPTIKWVLMCTIVLDIILSVLVAVCYYIPSIELNSAGWRDFYYRGDETFNTTAFPIGTLVFYLGANIIGFMYVQASNMNYHRSSLFLSRRMTTRDFWQSIAQTPVFWILSGVMVFRSPTDLNSSPCLLSKPNRACIGQDWEFNQVFWFNMIWVLFYTAGLQFTHLGKGVMKDFSLTPEKMKQWPAALWVALSLVIVILLTGIGYTCYLYCRADVAWLYLGVFAGQIVFFTIVTFILRKSHSLHFHHYLIGMCIILCLGYQGPVVAMFHGYANGIMIEGGSRWGYDPIWYERQKPYTGDPRSISLDSLLFEDKGKRTSSQETRDNEATASFNGDTSNVNYSGNLIEKEITEAMSLDKSGRRGSQTSSRMSEHERNVF